MYCSTEIPTAKNQMTSTLKSLDYLFFSYNVYGPLARGCDWGGASQTLPFCLCWCTLSDTQRAFLSQKIAKLDWLLQKLLGELNTNQMSSGRGFVRSSTQIAKRKDTNNLLAKNLILYSATALPMIFFLIPPHGVQWEI